MPKFAVPLGDYKTSKDCDPPAQAYIHDYTMDEGDIDDANPSAYSNTSRDSKSGASFYGKGGEILSGATPAPTAMESGGGTEIGANPPASPAQQGGFTLANGSTDSDSKSGAGVKRPFGNSSASSEVY